MERTYNETEHQELFHRAADLHRPIPIHIPSALSPLGYFVFLKIPTPLLARFGGVVTRMQVDGLQPDNLELRAGEGFTGVSRFPSKTDGYTWLQLCRARASRGNGLMTFSGVPAELSRADVLLCTWPRFVESGEADDWLACQADPVWAPGGVPLGGIGCGKVELCRDGRFRNFSGNNNQDMPLESPGGLPHAFFSLRSGEQEVALTSQPIAGMRACPALTAKLEFPQVRLAAANVFQDIDVSVHCSAPLIPHNLPVSSLPGFIVRATVRNRGAAAQELAFRFAWPNLVGEGGGIGEAESRIGYGDGFYRKWDAPAGHSAGIVHGHGFSALRYGNAPSSVCPSADGHHFIALRAPQQGRVEINPDARRGSVSQVFTVPAGGTSTVDLALVWEMPHYVDLLGMDRGQYWQNSCRDGLDVLELLFGRFDEILSEGGALRELLGRSDLPASLQSRLLNCCYPLVSNSVLYRDGRFSINEGPTEMAACFGTLDQRLGAHAATQVFFPELNGRELEQFGRIQGPLGGMQHDLGHGTLEREAGETTWPDLTCSYVIQAARHAWTTGDRAFETAAWPRARKALLRHALWADEGFGVAQVGEGLGTSYDGYHYIGTTPYMATLWMAALRVGRRWALRQGDDEILPRIDAWLKAAEARLEADLWNGKYYAAYGSVKGPKNPNCHAGMLAGAHFSRLLCGEDILPDARMNACADALLALNFNPAFVFPPDECAPDGAAASDFSWLPYVEAFGLTALARRRPGQVLPLWEKMMQAVERNGASVADTRLMYRPLSGEPSWGAYYMTAPASWLVYEALLDFQYSPEEQVLRFAPGIRGRFALIHPTFWATGESDGGTASVRIERVFAPTSITIGYLELPKLIKQISVDKKMVSPTQVRGGYAQFKIAPLDVRPGATIKWGVRAE